MSDVPAQRPDPRQHAIATIRDTFLKAKSQIALALPRHMTPDRMIRVALTTIQRTPRLADCTPLSLVGALMECSQMGLEPDGMLGHAHLVPFWNNKTNAFEAKLIPGYKGLIALAYRSGLVSSIHAEVVYSRDKFDFAFGLNERLEHVPFLDGDRGDRRAVYAVARMKDGSHAVVVMSLDQVEAIRKRSRAKDDGPWATDYDAMMCKTAVRQLAKWIPQSPELQEAAAKEEQLDAVDVDLSMPTAPLDGPAVSGPGAAPAQLAAGPSDPADEPVKRGRGRPRLTDKLREVRESARPVHPALPIQPPAAEEPQREPGED